jgi:hypothetical protein
VSDELTRRRRELGQPVTGFELLVSRYGPGVGSPDSRLTAIDGRDIGECVVEAMLEISRGIVSIAGTLAREGHPAGSDLPCCLVTVTRAGSVRVIVDTLGHDDPSRITDWLCDALAKHATSLIRDEFAKAAVDVPDSD